MDKIKFFAVADNDTSTDADKILEKMKKDISEDDRRIANQFINKDFDKYMIVGDGPYAGGIRIIDENGEVVYDDSS